MSIKNTLKEIIIEAVKACQIDITINDTHIRIKEVNNSYITNIPNIIAKQINIDHKKIAEAIKNKLDNNSVIKEVIITDEVFLKIYISEEYLKTFINTIIKEKDNYGKNNYGNNEIVNISFDYQDNDYKLNIQNGTKAIYCDNLSRLMKSCGYNPEKECFIINDENNKELLIKSLKKELDNYRIYIDNYQTEKELYDKGIIERLLSEIRLSNYCYVNEDKLWLKTTTFGDTEDRLLIDQEGNYNRFLPFLAYNYKKLNNGNKVIINIIQSVDNNTNNYPAYLKILDKNKKYIETKNSGGITISNNKINYLQELYSVIDINTIRYYLCLYNINHNIDLDLDLVLKKNKDNPYYIIERTNTIISSILSKERKKIKLVEKYITLNSDITYSIMNKLSTFEDMIIKSCKQRNPSLIAYYIYELSLLFYELYENETIVTDNDNYTNERLNLLQAIKIVLNNSLDLIGIISREEI